jgi:hypothetical protein
MVVWARAAGEGETRGKIGDTRFCGSMEDFQCAGRPTWLGGLSCAGLH